MGSDQSLYNEIKKVNLSLSRAVEAHRVVRRRGFHIFLDNRLTDGVVNFSALHASRYLSPRKIPGTHFY
jgi:hypothetical protein